MPKPRLFIGSSTEGLPIAEAVQGNVWRVAEVTVWTQGVFKPSRGSLDSILSKLNDQDFGLFVFSPDDVLQMRGNASNAIRDNVLLELGVFIGRLGAERCYFLIPHGTGETLHIPTDLVGINPLYYENDRSDGNWAAATGAASAEIKSEVTRLGVSVRGAPDISGSVSPTRERVTSEVPDSLRPQPQDSESKAPLESDDVADTTDFEWMDAYQARDFKKAATLLKAEISKEQKPELKPALVAWHGRTVYRFDPSQGERLLRDAIAATPLNGAAYVQLASAYLLQDDRPDDALAVAESGLTHIDDSQNPSILLMIKADAIKSTRDVKKAIEYLRAEIERDGNRDEPRLYIALAKMHEDIGDHEAARRVLDLAVRRLPTDEDLLHTFAVLLEKHFDKKVALIPRNKLVALDAKNADHVTYRANLYMELELVDLAFEEYERASGLAKPQGWILSNLGNVYRAQGLNGAAIRTFNKALAIDPASQYTHERLAQALDAKSKEDDKLAQLEKDAHAALTAMRAADRASLKTPPPDGTPKAG